MNITFTAQPFPELTLTGNLLTDNGFTVDTPIKLLLRQQALWVTTVTDEQEWQALCEASQYDQDLGADWVHNDGRLVIGGDWLTEIGITQAGHVDVATAPGIIIIRRREGGVFRA
ncbi:hypothetical protein ACMV8I_15595 [Ewingella sp. S1.OA.A_B6]